MLFYFRKKGLKGARFWNFAYLEAIFNIWNSKTRQMSKNTMGPVNYCVQYIIVVRQNTVSNTLLSSDKLLCPIHYCRQTKYCVQYIIVVRQNTVSNTLLSSNKIQCPHLLLICTCSTFPCQHAVVSYFVLRSPLFINLFKHIWLINSWIDKKGKNWYIYLTLHFNIHVQVVFSSFWKVWGFLWELWFLTTII